MTIRKQCRKWGLWSCLAVFFFITLAIPFLEAGVFKIERGEFYAHSRLGDLELYHREDGFVVAKNGEFHPIQNCFVDDELRNVSDEKLNKFLGRGEPRILRLAPITQLTAREFVCIDPKDLIEITGTEKEKVLADLFGRGYIAVNQTDDGEYTLRAHIRAPGGGPIAGIVAYWVTKSLCYGTAAAGATAIVVSTGGLAGAATGAVAGGAAAAIGGGAGAAVAGGAIAGGGLATEAALMTTSVVTNAGGFAAAAAAVEGASTGVGLLFGSCPFLP